MSVAEVPVIDLPTQIQVAARWADRERTDQAKAVLRTLEWLYANEAKIKAKVDTADQQGTVEPMRDDVVSTRVYRQRVKMFLDFPKGGWSRLYEIIDDTDQVIGTMEVGVDTRKSKERREFVPVGFRTFDNAKAFITAYEAGEWKPREAAPA